MPAGNMGSGPVPYEISYAGSSVLDNWRATHEAITAADIGVSGATQETIPAADDGISEISDDGVEVNYRIHARELIKECLCWITHSWRCLGDEC